MSSVALTATRCQQCSVVYKSHLASYVLIFCNAYGWFFDMQIYKLYLSGVLGGQKRASLPLRQEL